MLALQSAADGGGECAGFLMIAPIVLLLLVFTVYFVVNTPTVNMEWVNGVANPLSWTKGKLDGLNGIDIELARLSVDGLYKVASNGKYDLHHG